MIRLIDISQQPNTRAGDGSLIPILSPEQDGTRVAVSFRVLPPAATLDLPAGPRTRVAYVLEGTGGVITRTTLSGKADHSAPPHTGVYLEPGEESRVAATESPLTLLIVSVPKYGERPAPPAPAGYFFDESSLRALVDEKRIRERTFWVNKETGLSGSWDLQLGRMKYAPHARSPRHVHRASSTSPVAPEHFYLIEKGRGEVKFDGGALPVGRNNLVLIPAGEWHQLVASETGFDYIEFQAPFDFVTTMDDDPLGKNWYIKGSDDGTGRETLWVQS